VEKPGFWQTVRMDSGWLRVARGGSGAKSACRAPRGVQKPADWDSNFLMVYINNAGRLGAGFISVCLETRWLGHLGGFYVLG